MLLNLKIYSFSFFIIFHFIRVPMCNLNYRATYHIDVKFSRTELQNNTTCIQKLHSYIILHSVFTSILNVCIEIMEINVVRQDLFRNFVDYKEK